MKEQVRGARGELLGPVLPGGHRNSHGATGPGTINVEWGVADDHHVTEGDVAPGKDTCALPSDARQPPPVGIVRAKSTNPEIWQESCGSKLRPGAPLDISGQQA